MRSRIALVMVSVSIFLLNLAPSSTLGQNAGKKSGGLPDWFKELDTNRDGQVALYEWRKGGKDIDEFREWDRNDDGFITADEAIFTQRLGEIEKALKRLRESRRDSKTEFEALDELRRLVNDVYSKGKGELKASHPAR